MAEQNSNFDAQKDADATAQAQHSFSNDVPTDVNCNAILAREQGRTIAQMGNGMTAAAERRSIMADALIGK